MEHRTGVTTTRAQRWLIGCNGSFPAKSLRQLPSEGAEPGSRTSAVGRHEQPRRSSRAAKDSTDSEDTLSRFSSCSLCGRLGTSL